MKLYSTEPTVVPAGKRDSGVIEASGRENIPSMKRLVALAQLTKPKIMLLVLVTGGTALVLEGSLLSDPVRFLLFLAGLYMTGGAANAFNQYFERDIDARMTRTRKRRPLPRGMVSPPQALVFSIVLGSAGVALLAALFNLLTAALALATILFYSLVYTLWLKPTTEYNIVIGGIAGAIVPVGAWAAGAGAIGVTPMILFLIIFLWTPPHFWSLALYYRSDYEHARLSMLPVVKGAAVTLREISVYSVILVAASFGYAFSGGGGIYIGAAGILGAALLRQVWLAYRWRDSTRLWRLFSFTILYLSGLFVAMIIDNLIRR